MTSERSQQPDVSQQLEDNRRYLWAICYRMAGTAADADELVQETFARALEHPPPDPTLPWQPWLVRIAVNLARDLLRRRKVRGYPGQWLPEPVELDSALLQAASGSEASAERRYDTFESLSFAFLLALEVLTPTARAVLLLRDALDYSVRETSEALGISEANVKTTLHRARTAMAEYDRSKLARSAERDRLVENVLFRMLGAMATGDVAAFEALLSEDVRAISDGGGLTFAAAKPVQGRGKVARMYIKLAAGASPSGTVNVVPVNGSPGIVGEDPDIKGPAAPRVVLRVELDRGGLIREIHSQLNPDKLRRLFLARVGRGQPFAAAVGATARIEPLPSPGG